MKQLRWKNIIEPAEVTDKDIRILEKMLRVKFPDTYINIVKEHNEGYPIENNFEYIHPEYGEITSSIAFISVLLRGGCNIWDTIQGLNIDNQIPDRIVPFGEDGGGDMMCFDYRGGDVNPKIVYFAHDYYVGDGHKSSSYVEDNTQSIFPIANSFDEFLAMLYEPDNIKTLIEICGATLDVKFPAAYINFYKQYGKDKQISPNIFKYIDSQISKIEIKRLKTLIDIDVDTRYNVEEFYKKTNKAKLIPDKVIPFVETEDGNYVCFDYRNKPYEDDNPKIVYYEKQVQDKPYEIYKVADSFEEFQSKLY